MTHTPKLQGFELVNNVFFFCLRFERAKVRERRVGWTKTIMFWTESGKRLFHGKAAYYSLSLRTRSDSAVERRTTNRFSWCNTAHGVPLDQEVRGAEMDHQPRL